MKILLTVHQFYPDYFSGTEVLTFSVAKELIRRGHTVAVLTGYPSTPEVEDADRTDEYDLEGMHVYRFHHAYSAMGGQDVVTEIEYDNHLATAYFNQILAQFKPDVIHIFHMIRLGARLIDAAINAGIPTYYTPTDFWSICPTAQLLLPNGKVCNGPSLAAGNCVKHFAQMRGGARARKFAPYIPDIAADIVVALVNRGLLPPHPMSREITAMSERKEFLITRLNWLDGIISPTRFMTKMLTENGVDQRLILASGYGIDVAGYNIAPPALGTGRPLMIGYIGTLSPHKGCHVLIEAFKLLPRGAARLKIYGNLKDFAEYNASLRQRAEGFDAIEFCGTFPNGDIGRVLGELDVLVVPSMWYENAPLVVYSALAAKRPVIASHFPGLSDVVKDNVNGMTFRPGDFKALHARLERLVSDPSLLTRLSANCRPPKSTVEYVDELLAVYKNGPRSALAPSERRGKIVPNLEVLNKLGFMRGWAAIGRATPARIALRVGNTTLGETTKFQARPDVQASLQTPDNPVKSDAFGFTIRLPDGIDRREASLYCEARNGRSFTQPLLEIACEDTVQLGDGDYLAIDIERLVWKVDTLGFMRGWAAIGLAPPARIGIRVGSDVVGETTSFLPRPDVQKNLENEGHVGGDAFGFELKLPNGIDRRATVFFCEAQDGRTFNLSLPEVTPGNTASLGNGNYVAIETERLNWRARGKRAGA